MAESLWTSVFFLTSHWRFSPFFAVAITLLYFSGKVFTQFGRVAMAMFCLFSCKSIAGTRHWCWTTWGDSGQCFSSSQRCLVEWGSGLYAGHLSFSTPNLVVYRGIVMVECVWVFDPTRKFLLLQHKKRHSMKLCFQPCRHCFGKVQILFECDGQVATYFLINCVIGFGAAPNIATSVLQLWLVNVEEACKNSIGMKDHLTLESI